MTMYFSGAMGKTTPEFAIPSAQNAARTTARHHSDCENSTARLVSEGPIGSVRAPIGRHPVIIVNLDLAAAVAPIEFLAGCNRRRTAQFLVGEIEVVGPERAIVGQSRPRDRCVFLTAAEETAEAEHGMGDTPAELVDHQPLDGADLLAVGATDRRAFDPVA